MYLVSVVEKKKIMKNKQKKENSEFICKVCGQLFGRLYNLQRHEQRFGHQETKPTTEKSKETAQKRHSNVELPAISTEKRARLSDSNSCLPITTVTEASIQPEREILMEVIVISQPEDQNVTEMERSIEPECEKVMITEQNDQSESEFETNIPPEREIQMEIVVPKKHNVTKAKEKRKSKEKRGKTRRNKIKCSSPLISATQIKQTNKSQTVISNFDDRKTDAHSELIPSMPVVDISKLPRIPKKTKQNFETSNVIDSMDQVLPPKFE